MNDVSYLTLGSSFLYGGERFPAKVSRDGEPAPSRPTDDVRQYARADVHLGGNAEARLRARLYEEEGRYNDSERLYKRSLAIQEKVLGPEHPDVAG